MTNNFDPDNIYPDEEYIEIVVELTDEGETDAVGGGVPPRRIAEELGIAPATARTRCSQLADEGRLKRVRGVRPSDWYPRTSYLPLE